MLRGLGIADRPAPTLPAIIRTVHAAFIRGPQLSAFRAGAEQRRDCAGWLRPAVADALPTLASETAIQPAIRAASHVRGVPVRTTPIPRRLPVAPDRSPRCASSRPRGRPWASATWHRHRNFRNIRRRPRRAVYREHCGEWRARGCPMVHRARGRSRCGRRRSWTRVLRPRSRPKVVPVRAGDTQSSERDEYPVSAERTIPTTRRASPTCWSASTCSRRPLSTRPRSARCLPRPRPGSRGSH